MNILRSIAILGFLSAAVIQIASLFAQSKAMPAWGIPTVIGIFPLGFVATFTCMGFGISRGVWGRRKQWEYISGKCPKWAKKTAVGLCLYDLFIFAVMVAISGGKSAPNMNPLFLASAWAMTFYWALAMTFHAASSKE